MLALIGLTHDGNAQEVQKKTEVKKKTVPSLEGSWSGGGSVSFASGSREQARCRAHTHILYPARTRPTEQGSSLARLSSMYLIASCYRIQTEAERLSSERATPVSMYHQTPT